MFRHFFIKAVRDVLIINYTISRIILLIFYFMFSYFGSFQHFSRHLPKICKFIGFMIFGLKVMKNICRKPSLSPVPGPSGVKDSLLYQKKSSARQLGEI